MNTNYDAVAKLEVMFLEEFKKQVRELGMEKLAPQPGEHILEIVFGTAHSLTKIARAVGHSGKAVGFDVSKLAQSGRRGASLLPHEANGWDGIFTSYTMESFDAPPLSTVLDECKRVLRPGGRIVVIGVPNACEQGPDCDPIYTQPDADRRRLRNQGGRGEESVGSD